MRTLVLVSALALAVAGCNSTQQNRAAEGALIGAAGGAIVGGIASGTAKGAAVGAAAGAAGGAIIGAVASRPGYCYSRNRYGERIVVRCPAGY